MQKVKCPACKAEFNADTARSRVLSNGKLRCAWCRAEVDDPGATADAEPVLGPEEAASYTRTAPLARDVEFRVHVEYVVIPTVPGVSIESFVSQFGDILREVVSSCDLSNRLGATLLVDQIRGAEAA